MYRLIIADDEKIVLNGIKNTIDWNSLGVEVAAVAGSGEEFYQKAVECMPDIALVDIRMPGIDGLTAIERLKPLLKHCQFIVFTAYQDFNYAKTALELGVMAYITKPVLKNEVIEKVRLAIRRLEAENPDQLQGREWPMLSIEKVKRYMQSHVDMNYTLMDAAEYMQMNPAYLSRYFKEKEQMTFGEYDKKLKMERACELLLTTNLKTYQVADRLGYKSVQHFSRIFKEYTSRTPMEFRQRREL